MVTPEELEKRLAAAESALQSMTATVTADLEMLQAAVIALRKTEGAPGYAGFMLAQALLAMLVSRDAMTRQTAGVLLRETAETIRVGGGPTGKAAQRLLMDLAGTYSDK